MSKLPTSMVQSVLETMYPHRRELTPCFLGDPGIGKTQGIYEFANSVGCKVVTFILSNTVPSEVSGIRMPDNDTKRLEVFDDARMASLQDGDILFLDEILEAPPMLWSACLTLIQDRIMASGRKLPDVFIVAASNYVASPGIIPASTRDRFQFIELEFDAAHWTKWFHKKYGVHVNEELLDRIRGDSDQYNILTPRRVTKLYEWLKDNSGIENKKKIVTSMFDSITCKLLMDMVHPVLTPQQQIKDVLDQSNIKVETGLFEVMSLKSILEYLQSLPEWESIQYVLSTTEFEKEEEVEF